MRAQAAIAIKEYEHHKHPADSIGPRAGKIVLPVSDLELGCGQMSKLQLGINNNTDSQGSLTMVRDYDSIGLC